MKSFRAEKQRRSASTQVILTLLVLMASIVLARLLPQNAKPENQQLKSNWEASVIKLP